MKAEITEINETTKTILAENIKLKSSLEVSKTVSNRLSGQVNALEIQLNKSDQYSRRECLEIVGIPESIRDCDLEDKSLEVFKSIGVSLTPEKVHACHSIGRNGRVIIKLVNRKDVQAILVNKKKLKESDKSKIDLKANTKVFINESLCPYYKGIWSRCKKLLTLGEIDSFWTSNGTVKVKLRGEDKGTPCVPQRLFRSKIS